MARAKASAVAAAEAERRMVARWLRRMAMAFSRAGDRAGALLAKRLADGIERGDHWLPER